MLEQYSSTVLTYTALAICTNNLTNNCDKYLWYLTYQYCYYGNESVTNIYNMCSSRDMP